MRFPVGLRARLWRRSFLQPFGPESSAILQLSPLVRHFPSGAASGTTGNPESEWHSAQACVKAAAQARAIAVWLGGTEPLFHPTIGDVTSALTDSGRYVFLHTSGAGLRKRIHEFKPNDRLFLTVEIPLGNASSPSSAAAPQTVLSSTAWEALRAAYLSGFRLCAHFTVAEGVDSVALTSRINALERDPLDGLVMSTGNSHSSVALKEATRLVPSSAWRHFSWLLQSSYQPAAKRATVRPEPDAQTQSAEACEESA